MRRSLLVPPRSGRVKGNTLELELAAFSCLVSGHSVGVESFTPIGLTVPSPVVVLLHARDGPGGVADDRSYGDLARAVAAGGFRVLMPRYFERRTTASQPSSRIRSTKLA